MNYKILLIGSSGQIGYELAQSLANEFTLISSASNKKIHIDLSLPESIDRKINNLKPDLIINAAAYTEVDSAEENINLAYSINSESVGQIAKIAHKLDIPLIHYSSDYVFDGTEQKPKSEKSKVNPLSIYGKSKLEGEKNIIKSSCKFVILRTSWVYSSRRNNFLKTILKLSDEKKSLRIINDQISTPTSARFLSNITHMIIKDIFTNKNFEYGIYNCVPEGHVTWFEFANYIVQWKLRNKIKNTVKLKDIIPIKTNEYQSLAQRPLDSRLCNAKIKKILNKDFPAWNVYTEEVLGEIYG